jgi:CPA1 family monovalent cation:H+ antiporter
MIPTIQLLVGLLLVISVIGFVAVRLKVPASILLVLAGVALGLPSALPNVELSPEVVLLLVLPPIIYSASVAMSWSEFRSNLRPIALLAVGCVVFTASAVAAAAHYWMGFSWQLGFVLGAIVSPPDAVAPLSIARRLHLPRRIVVILEGEGIANDATALILYRFAVAAVGGGVFSMTNAVGMFAAIVVGELLWGVAVGWLMLRLRRWVGNPRVEVMLSVLTPFVAYWPPEFLGGSGVLATVTTGLYISWNGLRLISAPTRLQGIFFWDFLIYLIEGMVFLLTGLQAHTLVTGLKAHTLSELAVTGAIVSVVVIVTRFVWMYPATYLPRWLSPALARHDPAPPWQWPFVLAFTGVRGIVSLAAALALPLTTSDGAPFPNRDLILVLAFLVVLVTLVGQGLTLPWVVRALGLANAGLREQLERRIEESQARKEAIEAASSRLDALAADADVPDDVTARLRAHYRQRLAQNLIRSEAPQATFDHPRSDDGDERRKRIAKGDQLESLLIAAERDLINEKYRQGALKPETRRRLERELDLRDAQLASVRNEDFWE